MLFNIVRRAENARVVHHKTSIPNYTKKMNIFIKICIKILHKNIIAHLYAHINVNKIFKVSTIECITMKIVIQYRWVNHVQCQCAMAEGPFFTHIN